MKVTIDVTAEDIADGVPDHSRACPIALAIERTLPHLGYIMVDEMPGVDLGTTAEDAVEVELPAVASEFIAVFDSHQGVAPFSFELDVPGELLAAGTVQP